MSVLTETDAREHRLHGVRFTSYVRSDTGATALAGWRADFEPRTPGQTHRMSAEEVLLVLEGRLQVRIEEEEREAGPGDVVLVPAGATFCVTNASDQPARAWVVTTLGMTATMAQGGETLAPPWAQ